MERRVACIQVPSEPYERDANLSRAEWQLRRAAREGASLILLPELFNVGMRYERRLREHGETVGGPTTEWLLRWSRRTGALVGGGMAEMHEGRLYDSFVLAGPSGRVQAYRKRYPALLENLFFHRGDEIGIFPTELGNLGVMICWDMTQSTLCRELAGKIDLLLICSAWPDMFQANWPVPLFRTWMARQLPHRPIQLAKKLRVPVAYVNASGAFDTPVPWLGLTYRCRYAGQSTLVDADGDVQCMLDGEEGLAVGKLCLPITARRAAEMAAVA